MGDGFRDRVAAGTLQRYTPLTQLAWCLDPRHKTVLTRERALQRDRLCTQHLILNIALAPLAPRAVKRVAQRAGVPEVSRDVLSAVMSTRSAASRGDVHRANEVRTNHSQEQWVTEREETVVRDIPPTHSPSITNSDLFPVEWRFASALPLQRPSTVSSSVWRNSPPRGKSQGLWKKMYNLSQLPRGEPPRGEGDRINSHTSRTRPYLRDGQNIRTSNQRDEVRRGGRKAYARSSLPSGGAGSSDTKKRTVLKLVS